MKKTRKKWDKEKGFTLIEVCIVTIISGLLFASLYEVYERYSRQQAFDVTYDRIQHVNALISAFKNTRGRYPCPADRFLPVTDPNFGREIDPTATSTSLICDLSSLTINLSPTNCYSSTTGITPAGSNGVGGVCMVDCKDIATCGDKSATDTYVDGAGTTRYKNVVLIGAVPIRALMDVNLGTLDQNAIDSTFDAWGSRLEYVVTGQLTSKNTFKFELGVITVHDENGNDTASIVNNGHFGLVSHGPDRIGGYTKYGKMSSICGAHVPSSFANPQPGGPGGDDQNCGNYPVFIQGIRNDSKTGLHNDDTTNFTIVKVGGLWAPFNSDPDMVNKNDGYVNMGTDGIVTTPPATGVALNVDDPAGAKGIIRSPNNTKSKQICDKAGANCFDIAAVTSAAGNAKQTIKCPAGQIMTGITTDSGTGVTSAICANPKVTAMPNQACHNQWMIGIASDGTIICGLP